MDGHQWNQQIWSGKIHHYISQLLCTLIAQAVFYGPLKFEAGLILSPKCVVTYCHVFLMFMTNNYITHFVKATISIDLFCFWHASTSTIWSHSLWFEMVSCSPVRHNRYLTHLGDLLFSYPRCPPPWFIACTFHPWAINRRGKHGMQLTCTLQTSNWASKRYLHVLHLAPWAGMT